MGGEAARRVSILDRLDKCLLPPSFREHQWRGRRKWERRRTRLEGLEAGLFGDESREAALRRPLLLTVHTSRERGWRSLFIKEANSVVAIRIATNDAITQLRPIRFQ